MIIFLFATYWISSRDILIILLIWRYIIMLDRGGLANMLDYCDMPTNTILKFSLYGTSGQVSYYNVSHLI